MRRRLVHLQAPLWWRRVTRKPLGAVVGPLELRLVGGGFSAQLDGALANPVPWSGLVGRGREAMGVNPGLARGSPRAVFSSILPL